MVDGMDLRKVAASRGVSGRQIAAHMQVSHATVSRWLNRRVDVPPRHVRELASMLAIDPTDILPAPTRTDGDEQPAAEPAG